MNGLPDFIVQNPPLDAQLPPPYGFEDVGIRMFPLRASRANLDALCDYFINDIATANGLGFRVEPIQGVVLMEVLSYPKMLSRVPQQAALGFSRQNEFLFAIPVVYRNSVGVPAAVGLFVPFLCVDNDWSLITGRDVVGFPKVYGEFEVPEVFASAHPLSVNAQVLETFHPDSAARMAPLLNIETSEIGTAAMQMIDISDLDATTGLTDLAPKTIWPYGPVDTLYHPANGLLAVSEEIYALLLQSAGISVRNYSLKQFRDALDTDKACYQSILECETALEGFDSVGTFINSKITLHQYDSIRLIDAFGLEHDNGVLQPLFQIRYKGDFGLEGRRSLYTSCGGVTSQAQERSCLDLIGAGIDLTRGLIRRQLDVAQNICETFDDGRCHPRYYEDDLRSGCRNAVKYCSRMSELWVEGVGHLFRF